MGSDPRHLARRKIIKALYAWSFNSTSQPVLLKIIPQVKKIDQAIKRAAPTWPLTQINRVDLAILRLAVFELHERKIPEKVIINEAIELAKEFGSEKSPTFINGVLGTIWKKTQDA